MSLIVDLLRAVAQIGDRAFRRVLLRGLAITVATLVALSWAVMALLGWALPDTVSLPWFGTVGFVDNLASWAALGLMLVLSVVLMVPVAAVAVGFFLEEIVAAVERRHYPGLGTVAPLGLKVQLLDAVRFLGVVVAANLLALVVYFAVAPLAPFVFWLVNGYLLGREYFHLVAMRRLGPDGAAALRKRHAARIWLGGTLMAVPLSVPLVNLLVPILGVAFFTHQFHRLAARR